MNLRIIERKGTDGKKIWILEEKHADKVVRTIGFPRYKNPPPPPPPPKNRVIKEGEMPPKPMERIKKN